MLLIVLICLLIQSNGFMVNRMVQRNGLFRSPDVDLASLAFVTPNQLGLMKNNCLSSFLELENRNPILFRSYCLQKFHLEESIDSDILKSTIELTESGEVVEINNNPRSASDIKKVCGSWALGVNNELRMTLKRTFKGKFTEHTINSLLVGDAAELSSSKLLVVGGEILDQVNDFANSVGEFVLVPLKDHLENNNSNTKSLSLEEEVFA